MAMIIGPDFVINKSFDDTVVAAEQDRLTPEAFSIELIRQLWEGNKAFSIFESASRKQVTLGTPGEKDFCLPLFTSKEKAESFLRTVGKSDTFCSHPIDLGGFIEVCTESAHCGWHINPGEEGNLQINAQNLLLLYHTSRLYTGGLHPHQALRYYIAHTASFSNEDALANASACGCFKCKTMFTPAEITEWLPEENGKRTAVCPHCGADAVVPSTTTPAKGYTLDNQLLDGMYLRFFNPEFNEGKDPDMRMLFLSIMQKRVEEFLQSRSQEN